MIDQLSDVHAAGDETILTNLVSFKDLLPKQTSSFYRYSGSLTILRSVNKSSSGPFSTIPSKFQRNSQVSFKAQLQFKKF